MINRKYTDNTNQVVARVNEDGTSESCLVTAIADWLSEGNTPEPTDVPQAPTARELLDKLDTENTLTQRNLRDFIMLTTEALKRGIPVDLSAIPGVQRVISVEAKAAELRAKLC